MRHLVDGRKFGRNTSHRLAMFRNMANSVIKSEQVTTSVQKAKEVRRVVDQLITLGKKLNQHSRRLAFDRTRDDQVVRKLFGVLAERYKERNGGYTRVIRLAERRRGDAAEMAILELVDHPEIDRKRKRKGDDAAGSDGNAVGGTVGSGGDASSKTGSEEKKAKDPFSRFKRLFSGKSKVIGQSQKGGGLFKGGAGRKTPAGGGSSKMGGSS